MAKAAASKTVKAPTKTEVYAAVAEDTGLTKKEVASVIDSLTEQVRKALSKKGPGAFTIPGLLKITKKYVPAKTAQKNVPNPFKPGEFRDIAAKPAHHKVQVRALKGLKEMV